MLYIKKIGDYLKILTDHEIKDFVVIKFGECFKYMREKLYSKLSEEQNLTRVAELLYIFLTIPDKLRKYAELI